MKIAYDCQVFSWQDYGGISRYFIELAGRVARTEGFDAEVVAPLHVNEQLRNAGIRVVGLHVSRRMRIPGRIFRGINRAASVSYLCAASPQILHETYYGNWSYRPPRASVVVTIHDMADEKFPSLYASDNPMPARKARAIARADAIICVSEHTRRDLMERFSVPEERTRVIYHGHSLSRQHAGHLSHPAVPFPYLLYVGDRDRQKNFGRLLEALASSPRLQRDLVLVAFGRQALRPHEVDLIRRLGLAADCVIHRTGNDDVLASYYRHATALVYPSLYEGFGLPPLEAMSFGCPVVCSDSSSIPEVVGDAGILFDPGSSESLRVAIEQAVYSEATRNDLVERGRRRIELFSWERCAMDTMKLYRDLRGT